MRSDGEFELIAAIRERLAGAGGPADRLHLGIGDDAAVTVPGGATATTIDAVVDGVHFRRAWCPPEAVGRRAMATALSDLAAMGAEPGEAYVWLGRPPDLDRDDCLRLADGLAAVAGACGVTVAGGDLTAAPALSVCVAAVGHADESGGFVGRDGASEGCAVCLTGTIGGAAAGLLLLERPELAERLDPATARAAVERQLSPAPLLEAGRALARSGALAMIDLSDGLGGDAEQLAAASGVALELTVGPGLLDPAVEPVAAAVGEDPLELATGSGEDYELLCALPRESLAGARAAVEALGGRLREIGRAVPGSGVSLSSEAGRALPVRGYDQLG